MSAIGSTEQCSTVISQFSFTLRMSRFKIKIEGENKMRKAIRFAVLMIAMGGMMMALNLNGTWVNENMNTRGITKLAINNSQEKIRAWGECHPHDCDWGNVHFIHTSKGILASWRQPGIGHKVILAERINNHRIKVTAKLLYCDARSDKTRTYYFRKAPRGGRVGKPFLGSWTNIDPYSRGITKIAISRLNGKVYLHAWGKCHPTDCDWGRSIARRDGARLIVKWHQGFVDRTMFIRGLQQRPDGRYRRIRVRLVSHYHDSRGTKVMIYYFDRS